MLKRFNVVVPLLAVAALAVVATTICFSWSAETQENAFELAQQHGQAATSHTMQVKLVFHVFSDPVSYQL
jgi:hypothetical protein